MNKLFLLTICLLSANLAFNQQDTIVADFADTTVWMSNGAGTVEQIGNTAIFKNISDQEYKIRCKKKINYKKPFTLSMDIKIVNSGYLDFLLFLENKMPAHKLNVEKSVQFRIMPRWILAYQWMKGASETVILKAKENRPKYDISKGISIQFSQDKTNRMTVAITDIESGEKATLTTNPYLILDNYNSLMLKPEIKRGAQLEISNFKFIYTLI